jgi:hypothetical protein
MWWAGLRPARSRNNDKKTNVICVAKILNGHTLYKILVRPRAHPRAYKSLGPRAVRATVRPTFWEARSARCMPLLPGCRARTHRPPGALVASLTTRGPRIDGTDRACSPLASSHSKVPAAPSSLGSFVGWTLALACCSVDLSSCADTGTPVRCRSMYFADSMSGTISRPCSSVCHWKKMRICRFLEPGVCLYVDWYFFQ